MLELNSLQEEIFRKRYALNSEISWEEHATRVGQAIAQVETNGDKEKWGSLFSNAIANGDFMPGGRILFGAVRQNQNMLNCYRLHPEDTVASIGKCIRDMYVISCGGGGIGFNFSDIRPKGDDIQNIKWSAPGSVSNMKMINEIGSHVRAGKNRRTALIAILNVTHPDILEFLHVKLTLKELGNFNISVGITNKFIEAVRLNKPWHFTFKGRTYDYYAADRVSKDGTREIIHLTALNEEDALGRCQTHRKKTSADIFENVRKENLLAKDIWNLIIENSWKCGDPGIYNLDLANHYTNVGYFENLDSPNPCGEMPLPAYGNCDLGHINLNNMYDAAKNDVDWKKLAKCIRIAIRFLDDTLTANTFPIPECKDVGERSRRIGLGVTGLHYLLIKLGHKYGDEKCLEFLDRLFATFRNEAYLASIELAKEKGSFPAFDAEKYCESSFIKQLPPRIQRMIRQYGIRNAVMLTIAPCGTNSMVLGVSSGVEPIFAQVYERSFRDANVWKTELVADKLFLEFLREGRDIGAFVGAHEISVEQHIAVQATIQKYIDSAISKTTNIPKDYPVENLSKMILEYAPFVKGFTIYRTGSRDLEPLKPIKPTPEIISKLLMQHNESSESLESCKNGVCDL